MSKATGKPDAAIHAILRAITEGTKKMKGEEFFWGLVQQLRTYTPAKYDQLVAWLRTAGIRKAPSPEQCATAAKLARSRSNAILAAYGAATRDY